MSHILIGDRNYDDKPTLERVMNDYEEKLLRIFKKQFKEYNYNPHSFYCIKVRYGLFKKIELVYKEEDTNENIYIYKHMPYYAIDESYTLIHTLNNGKYLKILCKYGDNILKRLPRTIGKDVSSRLTKTEKKERKLKELQDKCAVKINNSIIEYEWDKLKKG